MIGVNDPYEVNTEECPDHAVTGTCMTCGETTDKETTMKVRFHPQAWIRDYAVDVDAEGDTEFDVGDVPADMKDNRHDSDELRYHANAPAWIKTWQGPFYIEILREDNVADAN